MIFVTIGTQLPFDRLIRAMDQWAGNNKNIEVFAQIGPTDFRPQNMKWTEFVDPVEAQKLLGTASVVVAHAGMGTIISRLSMGKPIIIVPRSTEFREHRNDHQLHTARQFANESGVYVAYSIPELNSILMAPPENCAVKKVESFADNNFIEKLESQIKEWFDEI